MNDNDGYNSDEFGRQSPDSLLAEFDELSGLVPGGLDIDELDPDSLNLLLSELGWGSVPVPQNGNKRRRINLGCLEPLDPCEVSVFLGADSPESLPESPPKSPQWNVELNGWVSKGAVPARHQKMAKQVAVVPVLGQAAPDQNGPALQTWTLPSWDRILELQEEERNRRKNERRERVFSCAKRIRDKYKKMRGKCKTHT
jgi:hypothetical protein